MKWIIFASLFWLLVVPVAHAQNANDPISQGEALFKARCTEQCHQTPKADHLSAKQWRVVLSTMQTRMKQSGMPPMSERQVELILKYVSAGAKK